MKKFDDMKRSQFICKLLTGVIINQKAATEGHQRTLDFIPGNTFLGVSAKTLYAEIDREETFQIFHSGKVRFGDAHPLLSLNDGDLPFRTYRTPAGWYTVKNKKIVDGVFITPTSESVKIVGNQFKQCRTSFIASISDNDFLEMNVSKSFAIKSAYDSGKRRAEDEKMYGYESLIPNSVEPYELPSGNSETKQMYIDIGTFWGFEVAFDDDVSDDLIKSVEESLKGLKYIGRSTTAQYGLVEISEGQFNQQSDLVQKSESGPDDGIWLYAESRLIFLDEDGLPEFIPDVSLLGFEKGEICLERSRIRFFQYAPYNSVRKTRDSDRCGIEKGSLFFVKGATINDVNISLIERGVGCFLNEGFGKVIVNPSFMNYEESSRKLRGKVFSSVQHEFSDKHPQPDLGKFSGNDKILLDFLQKERKKLANEESIYEIVNEFVRKNERLYQKEAFASQWGTIRSIAASSVTLKDLKTKLFEEPDQKKSKEGKTKLFGEPEQENAKKGGYLMHGVAKEKWDKRTLNPFKKFVENLNEEIGIPSVINLAAEMAKKSKRR